MFRRRLFERQPAVTNEDRRRVGKTKQRRHRLYVMLSVNEVGRGSDRVEVIDDGHGRRAQFACGVTEVWTVNDGTVAATKADRRQLTDVKLRSRAFAKEVVRDHDAKSTIPSSL